MLCKVLMLVALSTQAVAFPHLLPGSASHPLESTNNLLKPVSEVDDLAADLEVFDKVKLTTGVERTMGQDSNTDLHHTTDMKLTLDSYQPHAQASVFSTDVETTRSSFLMIYTGDPEGVGTVGTASFVDNNSV
uniref:kidney androgen-regulated protein-like isoform X2 n=1 Tax=Jaculus jaculus TaxID=51337 RepID=UPI001E1AFBEB|nr:kidney androgen-regulated protein-like isoform X2 [Jaculus jaculus]